MVQSGASTAADTGYAQDGAAQAGPTGYAARAPQPAFATAAEAQLFEGLGWRVAATSRRERAYHKPLRCCFLLRDGDREEAAFGYTGLTAPLDGENPALCAAQIRVERFLRELGEDSAVLVQNTPLIAFGGPRRDRLVVFGGWRFHERYWRPFVLGPEGLGGVSIQNSFFEAQTMPHHLAEIFGAPADIALPKITEVVSAIARFGTPHAASAQRTAPGLRIVPFMDGWSVAQPGTPAALTPLRRSTDVPPEARAHRSGNPLLLGTAQASPAPVSQDRVSQDRVPQESGPQGAGRLMPGHPSPRGSGQDLGPLNPLAPNGMPWDVGEDEFRFRHRLTSRP